MSEIEFEFEELATVIENGFEAGLINGTATIGYQADQEWCIREIALDGYKLRPAELRAIALSAYDKKPVALCRDSHPWLYGVIVDRLESEPWRSHIVDAIAEHHADARDEYRAQLGKDRAKGLEA